jgi:murein DD-endopeptidase MepM/ murein hydrolase activator NlpD
LSGYDVGYDGPDFADDEYVHPIGQDTDQDSPTGRRLRPPTAALRGRVVMAAVAVGAFAAAGAGHSLLPAAADPDATPSTDLRDMASVVSTNADDQQSLAVQPLPRTIDAAAAARQLATSQQLITQPGNSGAGQATGSQFVKPTQGTLTSTFGGKYGQLHYGIEIANVKDTPIVAVATGTIVDAGPVSGYGLWVKEQLNDGTILVYARMDSYAVQVGQQVTAGQQIALMGDRGFSAGYSLHFEVWQAGSTKRIDPVAWLNQQGITL